LSLLHGSLIFVMITISNSEPDGECNAGKTFFKIEILSLVNC
jgi:hypothetical protein